MIRLEALQHVYGNVEADCSPRAVGGFQTLLASPGLSAASIASIEPRVAYHSSEDQPTKRVYFVLDDGSNAVAQVVPLAERDMFGRGGRYLAHTLVFPPGQLEQVDNDPFAVLSAVRFFTSIEDARAVPDWSSGSIASTTVLIDQLIARRTSVAWRPDELEHLTRSGLRRASGEGRTLTVIGSPTEVEDILLVVFQSIPPKWRTRCSFDTYFYRCNPVGKAYWAVGQLEDSSAYLGTVIDAHDHRVLRGVPTNDGSAYEEWVVARLRNGSVAFPPEDANDAVELCDWLDGRGAIPASASVSLVTAFVLQFSTRVEARIVDELARLLPRTLMRRAFGELLAEGGYVELIGILPGGVAGKGVADKLWSAYGSTNGVIDAQERRDLGVFAGRTNDVRLKLVAAAALSEQPELARLLSSLDSADYRECIRRLLDLGLASPGELLVPGRATILVEETAVEADGRARQTLALARALIEAGESDALEALAAHVPDLGDQSLPQMAEMANRLESAHPLRVAVENEMDRRYPQSTPSRKRRWSLPLPGRRADPSQSELGENEADLSTATPTAVLCPFHLGDVGVADLEGTVGALGVMRRAVCPECRNVLPRRYLENCASQPPLVLGVVALRSHGASLFIATLLSLLQSGTLARAWPGFASTPLDQETSDSMELVLSGLERGVLPKPTPHQEIRRPGLFRLEATTFHAGRTLLCYDTGGALLADPTSIRDTAAFVVPARSVLLLVSLSDLREPARDMSRLIEHYIEGARQNGGCEGAQHLIVVFTKCDAVEQLRGARWQDIAKYSGRTVIDDPPAGTRYGQAMDRISNRVAEFTSDSLGAGRFLNEAQEWFASVEFCTVSALGDTSSGRRAGQPLVAGRVIDPLIWLMSKDPVATTGRQLG